MRRLLRIAGLAAFLIGLCVSRGPAQVPLTGAGLGAPSGGGGGPCVPNTQASAFLARVVTAGVTLDAAHIAATCVLINCQVTAGTFSLKDIQYAFATSSSVASLLNMVQNAFNGTANNSPIFTADAGWQSNGSAETISTGFNPATAITPQFVQNSAHTFLWNLTNATNGNAIAGNGGTGAAGESNFFIKLVSPPNLFVRLNDSVDNGGQAIGTPTGWLGGSRTSSTNIDYYQNGSTLGSVTQASASPLNAAFLILSAPSPAAADQSHQIGFWSSGAAMNSTQEAADYACVHAYMQTIAGVP